MARRSLVLLSKTNDINLSHWLTLEIWLQSLPINLKNVSISLIFYFNCTVRKHLMNHKWSRPFGSQFSRKKLQTGIVQKDQLSFPKLFFLDPPIVPLLGLFLVNLGIFVRTIPKLF